MVYWVVSSKEIEDIRCLLESGVADVKFKNKMGDLVEDLTPHGQPRKKKDDPTKKLKKEEIMKFRQDFKEFKEKNGMTDKDRVFFIEETYPFLKEEFKKRGWKENSDITSIYFDFKYAAAFKNIDLFQLFPDQIINHIIGASSFTKKVGLCKYLRGAVWECDQNPDSFYPRSYELKDNAGLFNFVQDFKGVESYNRLKALTKPENRVKEYTPDQFGLILEVAIRSTFLSQRVCALSSFVKETEKMEVSGALYDVLDFESKRISKSSFLLNKSCVRNSLLPNLGIVPKEDFIEDFLSSSRSKVTQPSIDSLYLEVLFYYSFPG